MAFAPEIVAAVLHHMNDDHTDDNLLIVRAFGPEADAAASATMTGLDELGGEWRYEFDDGRHATARIAWPSGSISERPEIRREVVLLYRAACAQLGVEPRAEEPARPHGAAH